MSTFPTSSIPWDALRMDIPGVWSVRWAVGKRGPENGGLGAQGAWVQLQRQVGMSRMEWLLEEVPGVSLACLLACHLMFLTFLRWL